MPLSQPASEKLVGYLSQLSPDVAVFLVREIELARSEGRDNPLYDLILDAARSVVRTTGRSIDRMHTPFRAFCDPFEDFLYTGVSSIPCLGRISRRSVEPVWQWLQSQYCPDDLTTLISELELECRLDNDSAEREDYTDLYERAARAIRIAHAQTESSTKARQRLEMQIGGRHVLADAQAMTVALENREQILNLRKSLPKRIAESTPETLALLFGPLDAGLTELDAHPELVFATLLARFVHPAHALRLACVRTRSRGSTQISHSSYAPLGNLILHDIHMAAKRVVEAFESAEGTALVLYSLADFHSRAETFEQELELDMRSPWGEALSAARRIASDPLDKHLRAAPRILSTLFRPLVDSVGTRGLITPNDDAIGEAQRSISFYAGCNPFLDQLSVNEAYMQAKRDVSTRLEALSTLVMRAIRASAGPDRQTAMSWLSVIVDLTKITLGPEDAKLLERAGQVASQSTATEGSIESISA